MTRHVLFPLTRLHRITLSKASRIIAVSDAVASQLRASSLVSPEKIKVVLNGIDTGRFAAAAREFDRAKFLVEWKLPVDSLLVGTVGELTPLKGQEEFLRAVSQITKHHPTAYFIVAGVDHSRDQKHRERLERLIEKLKLTERVKLVGWLGDLAQLYCALDVFVSASHTESFGLVLAEAMASGTAVVATRTEGAVEIIRPGETGLLVGIGDVDQLAGAIVELLENREQRASLGRAAQDTAHTRFSVERMVSETEEIYRAEMK